MHEIKFTLKNTTYTAEIPASWDECTEAQALRILSHLATKADIDRQRVYIFKDLLSGKLRPLFLAVDNETAAELIELVDWTQERLTRPIMTQFRHRGRRYALPEEKLANITCLEWDIADKYYEKYIKTHDEQQLNLLIATLARPLDPDRAEADKRDDRRIQLHSRTEVERRAKALKSLDTPRKLLILYFFAGCKAWVHETYTGYIFEEPDTDEDGKPIKPQGKKNPLGWYALYQSVAEQGVFGNMEQVLHTKFVDLCAFLVTKKKEFDRQQRELQEQKLKAQTRTD